jgi:hypothetical protein
MSASTAPSNGRGLLSAAAVKIVATIPSREADIEQATLWIIPDRFGDWWPGLQAIAPAIGAGLYAVFLLPPPPRTCEGASRFALFVACVMIAASPLNSGLKAWGDQVLQWSLVAYVACLVWRPRPQA